MASPAPLYGTGLIDCARANGPKGIEVAAKQCGYGDGFATFERELRKAGDVIGVEIQGFNDLVTDQRKHEEPGIEIAPDSPTQL